MQSRHTPHIDLRYWLGITLASVFGTNLGDLYAHRAALGIFLGITVLAAFCALVFVAEHFDRAEREIYYWAVIIIIRTGATNIADYTAYHLKVPELILNAALIILLAMLATLQGRTAAKHRESAGRLPATGTIYWLAMLAAGILGTVLGDVCEHAVGDGFAALGLSAALICVLWWRRSRVAPFYWLIVAVARTAGTAIGDWIAESNLLNLGLAHATLISGLLFVGVLLLWRSTLSSLETSP